MDRWIPCSERLPESWVPVLVITKHSSPECFSRLLCLNDDGVFIDEWRHKYDGSDSIATVTHWMPAPPELSEL